MPGKSRCTFSADRDERLGRLICFISGRRILAEREWYTGKEGERAMLAVISGQTKIYGLIGFPVRQTFSPPMHNAAFAAAGLDAVYLPFPVAPGSLPDAVRGLRGLGIAGWNVTLPYKTAVIALLDEIEPEAKAAGTVNTVLNRSGHLYGCSTDGAGFLLSLAEKAVEVADKAVLLLGAGGAARAVAFSLMREGVGRFMIANRTAEKAENLAVKLRNSGGRTRPVKTLPWCAEAIDTAAAAADIIINATSLGLKPRTDPVIPLSFDKVSRECIVCDLTYNPPLTPLLAAAAARGLRTVGGCGMLLYQAAAAFELWTGRKAPVEVMRQALPVI
jgi:shikimate dehydrogenase